MITWDDLRGKRVAVWGLGREGQASLRKLASIGVTDVVRVDDHPRDDTVQPVSALKAVDVVIKSPGISRYRDEVTALGVPVLGGLGLWLAGTDLTRVVCVTGTKGKSTTSAILGHLLTGLGHPATVAGNIGVVPWDPGGAYSGEYWVIEVSSYQATDLQCAPPVVAVTSLHPDHLDWHGGVERYYRDKLSLCTRPGADLTVANGDSELLRQHRDQLGPRVDWVQADEDAAGWPARTAWTAALGLPGTHNRRNALIASHCITALGIAVTSAELAVAAQGFRALPSRLTTIETIGGVAFVDDSLSTNVLPTLAALEAFPGRRVALIAGGHDRGIDYAPLAEGVAAREAPTLVLTVPDNGPRISAALGPGLARDCADLVSAVEQGFRWARPDGVVLLSPAAPSFGQFRDYRDRAEAFANAVGTLACG